MRKLALIAVLAVIVPAGVFGEDLVFVFTPPAINLVLESTDTAVFNVNMQGTGSNPNSGVLFITYLNGSGWLTISPTSGTFTPPQSSIVITGRVSAAALPGPGVYQALVKGKGATEADADAILLFPVTVVVKAPGARLALSQTTIVFEAAEAAPAPQTLSVFNLAAGTLNWSVTGMPSWLTVSPLSGTAARNQPSSVTLTANPAALTADISQAVLNVSTSGTAGSLQLVTVTFRVLLPIIGVNGNTAPPPAASLNPQGLVFLAAQGSTAATSQAVTLSNTGSGRLAFQLAASTVAGGWLSVTPSSGSQPAGATTLQIQANPSGLAAGLYRGKVTATFSPGAPQDVDVLLAVTPSAAASGLLPQARSSAGADCVPQSFDLVATTLGNGQSLVVSYPRVILALVVDSCGGGVNTATVLAMAGGTNITMQPLSNGLYTGNWVPVPVADSVPLTLTAIHPSFPNSVQRSYRVSTTAPDASQQLPVLPDDGVVEGAGFTPRRPLAPGGIVSLFGVRLAASIATASQLPLDRQLAGVSVQMGGLNAPLYFVSPGQINAQVPFELTPGNSIPILVTSGGRLTAPQNYFIAPAEPGVFITASGPAILDGRSRLVTAQNPALVGDTLQIFATGLGLTDVSAATGAAAPSFSTVRLPVTVTIGGVPASVVYQGLAPGYVGLYQINVVVPASVTAGSAVPLALTQNGVPSNPGSPITIPVQRP